CSLILVGTSAVAEEDYPPAKINTLYTRGEVNDARELLEKIVNEKLAQCDGKLLAKNAVAVEEFLANPSSAAHLLAVAFDFEKRTAKDNPLPKTLVELTFKVNGSVDEAIKSVAASSYAKDKRIKGLLDYGKRQRVNLLLGIMEVCRNEGNQTVLKRFTVENAAFLKEQNVSVGTTAQVAAKAVIAESSGESPIPRDSHWVADGTVLAITQVLLEYYQGLAAEDPELLDKCLYADEGYLDGKALVKEIELERSREGDFDKIQMPQFETTTRISVGLSETGLYDVRVLDVRKSVLIGKKVIKQRENDRFKMKFLGDKFKILIKEKKK
ncbi:hypothetical protein BVX99_00350, partial [bacterium F16]